MALFKRSATKDDDDDSVSLTDADHAWWAGRDHLERAFVPKQREGTDSGPIGGMPTNVAGFSEQYSTESLFNWASSSEPDDPTHGGTGLPLDPYHVLGLQPGATLSEVVAAHRSLAKRYHPDQLFDIDEPERAAAAQKMSTINAAYHELRARLMGPPTTH